MRNANAASDVGEDRAGRVHQIILKLRRALMLQVNAEVKPLCLQHALRCAAIAAGEPSGRAECVPSSCIAELGL